MSTAEKIATDCVGIMQQVKQRDKLDYQWTEDEFKEGARRIIEEENRVTITIDLDYVHAICKGDEERKRKMIGSMLRDKQSMLDIEFERIKPVIK